VKTENIEHKTQNFKIFSPQFLSAVALAKAEALAKTEVLAKADYVGLFN
jgi:hypothetical protein